ncbi:MAG: DegV family protein [Clostridia bacterium]|nr:DegV family protein [Clostridia bacterium]
MVRIVTDTASDITAEEAKRLKIHLIPLETAFEDGVCPMSTSEDYDHFYEKLRAAEKLPITSRPSPQAYLDIYLEAKKAQDDVLVITLSSGLSGTKESAHVAKEMADYPRITIVDSKTAVMAQRMLVEHACRLRDEGMSVQAIAHEMILLRDRVVVIGVIGSLVYLKKGGRIPPAMAILGDALGIKPVITVKHKIIQALGKARGMKAGVSMAYKRMEEDELDPSFPVLFGYTSSRTLGEDFMVKTAQRYGMKNIRLCQVNGIIGTHLGTDSIGLAYVAKK